MNSQVRFMVEECVSTYNGTSKTSGNPYTIGTWKLKGVTDGKIFVANAFSTEHQILQASVGLLMDAFITVEAREYNGKWYNDVKISNISNPDGGKVDVPTDQKAEVPQQATFAGEENDLPF